MNAGFNTCCADHLEQQLPPVKAWGTTYVATKSWPRGEALDIWRVLAARDGTQIVLDPPQAGVAVPTLNRGEWFEFESQGHFEVRALSGADKPILVGQYLAAQDAPGPNVSGASQDGDAGTGDPAFMVLPPVQQAREVVTLFTPAEYEESFVNVVVPTGASITVDGVDAPAQLLEEVGAGGYSVYRAPLDPGLHTISSALGVTVMAYGYEEAVSYGYPAGSGLRVLTTEESLDDAPD